MLGRRLAARRLLCAAGVVVLLAACQPRTPETRQFSGPTMGTTYHVTISQAADGFDAQAAQTRVAQVLEQVNQRMSTYREDSELSRLNAAPAGRWVAVSDALLDLLKQAARIQTETAGAFDVTVGPLVNLWGFGPEARPDSPPAEADIAQRMEWTGLRNFTFRDEPPAVRKRNTNAYIDLSAIAKGYGVDRVAEALLALGATDFLAEVGGELRAHGVNADGKPWQVAVETPRAGPRSVALIVGLEDAGMATSGDYRNFFESQGRRYSHTLDPRTGRPVEHDLHSVSVLANTTAHADALATALLVMGPDEGLAYARAHDLAALFISGAPDAYTQAMTPAFSSEVSEQP